MKPTLQLVAALRDRVGRETLVRGKELDNQELLNATFLPSKIFILLVAACATWVAILTGAFLVVTGYGIGVGWIFAGAVVAALGLWVFLMTREVKQAMICKEPGDPEMDDCHLCLDCEPMAESNRTHERMGNRLPFRPLHSKTGERCPGLSFEIGPKRRNRTKSPDSL